MFGSLGHNVKLEHVPNMPNIHNQKSGRHRLAREKQPSALEWLVVGFSSTQGSIKRNKIFHSFRKWVSFLFKNNFYKMDAYFFISSFL